LLPFSLTLLNASNPEKSSAMRFTILSLPHISLHEVVLSPQGTL
jgi:hypothetical protein